MKVFKIFMIMVGKYPRQFLLTTMLLLLMNVVEMGSVLSIAPAIDLITKPDLKGITPITARLLEFLKQISLPANVYGVILLIAAFVLFRVLISLLVNASIVKIKYSLTKDTYCSTFKKFFDAGWNFFVSNSQGMLGNTFSGEINKVAESLAQMVVLFVTFGRAMFLLILAFIISWKLSLIITLLSGFAAMPFSFLGDLVYRLGKKDTETANRIYGTIQENLSAAKIVIGFGEQRKGLRRLEKAIDDHIKVVSGSLFINQATPIVFQAVGMGILLFMLFLSLTVIKTSITELAVVFYSFYSALPLIGQTVAAKNMLLNFFPAYEQLNGLLMMAKEEVQTSGEVMFESLRHQIILSNVGFSYPESDRVLSDVSITIPKGKTIAFVGRSGVGKSTLVDLLLRLYDPDSGEILIDGINLKEFNLFSWRQRVGYVPQESILFDMSVRENLKWSKDDATDDEIMIACKMANVDEFLDVLPQGLDTIVGDRGVRLSGGQRQRLALARAILRKPDLLILDEATSSLDSHSEKMIQNAIENISHETTVVVVAHRLSTVINADRIYFMDKGIIIEQGTFRELCSMKGKYFDLAKAQGITA